jgi:hypothetical protein
MSLERRSRGPAGRADCKDAGVDRWVVVAPVDAADALSFAEARYWGSFDDQQAAHRYASELSMNALVVRLESPSLADDDRNQLF